MCLKDKVILVTGSSTGIGEAMVRIFGAEGARVIAQGTRESAAKELVADLKSQKNQAGHVIATLGDPAPPKTSIDHVIATYGRIDGLVNNAAVMTRSDLETTDIATFDRTIAITLPAPFLLFQATFPSFKKQGGGAC